MSNINYTAIVTTYPVAGQDNDSQGFRDNFTAIANGLQTAKTEITTLQTNSISVGAGVTNNLLQATLSNGLYNQLYGTYFDGGTIPSSANIDLTNGPTQKFTLSGTPTLTFINWPTTGQSGYIKVHIASDQSGVRYPVFATSNSGLIHYDTSFPTNPVTSSKGFTVGGESVATFNIGTAGSGYTSPATISYSSVSPITGGYTPTTTITYTIVSATVTGGTGGTGYTQNDTITINGYPGVIITVSTVSSGVITTLSVTQGGSFTAPLTGIFNTSPVSSTGTGAKIALSFGVLSITSTNGGGDGYTTTPPTVTISAPGGSGVTATATAVLTTQTSTLVKVIEAWSNNAGADVYIRYLGEY